VNSNNGFASKKSVNDSQLQGRRNIFVRCGHGRTGFLTQQ